MAHHHRHAKLGPPKHASEEFTLRHIASWPHKFPITNQHVQELLRLARVGTPLPTEGGGEEMHVLLHLLAALSAEALCLPNDTSSLAQHLHARVATPQDAYILLVGMKEAALDVVEGRRPPMPAEKVEWIKAQLAARLSSRSANSPEIDAPTSDTIFCNL